MKVLEIKVLITLVVLVHLCNAGTPTADVLRKPVSHLEVRFAALVYRHGDRTIIDPYPNDPWKNPDLWPDKFGELTNTGIRQHYEAGQSFRKRYSKLISEKFDPDEVSVRSTDVDRTLMSAQANLAGMFPPVGKSVWNKTFPWRPVPIHTVPTKEDEVLAMAKECKMYHYEMDNYLASDEYQHNLDTEKMLMSFLTTHTGREVKDFRDVEYLYNTLYVESVYNFSLPPWTENVFPDRMIEASLYSFIIPTATPKLAKLKVGPLLKEITDGMQKAVEAKGKTEKYKKMLIYSAHDDTVVNVLNSLNIFHPHFPSYTATVHFELVYDNATEVHSVRVLYRNTAKLVDPVPLVIPECGTICPLDSFLRLYNGIIPKDWDFECNRESPRIVMCTFFVMAVVLIYSTTRRLLKFYEETRPIIQISTVEKISVRENLAAVTIDADVMLRGLNGSEESLDEIGGDLDTTDNDSSDTTGTESAAVSDTATEEFEAPIAANIPEIRLNEILLDPESAQTLIANERGYLASAEGLAESPAVDSAAIRENLEARMTLLSALHPNM